MKVLGCLTNIAGHIGHCIVHIKLASTVASAKKLDNLCQVGEEGCFYLFQQSHASSLVSEVLATRGKSGAYSSPMDNDGCRFHCLGQQVYVQQGLQVASFPAIINHYEMLFWDHVSQFVEFIPDERRTSG